MSAPDTSVEIINEIAHGIVHALNGCPLNGGHHLYYARAHGRGTTAPGITFNVVHPSGVNVLSVAVLLREVEA